MKKHRALMAVICTAAMLAGSYAVAAEEQETTQEAEGPKGIGKAMEGENVFCVTIENATEKGIKDFSVRYEGQEAFPENMLMTEAAEEVPADVFLPEEVRILYYDATEAVAAADRLNAEAEEGAPAVEPTYEVRMIFEDDEEMILHAFPFGDFAEGKIERKSADAAIVDDAVTEETPMVAFFTYVSLTTEEEVSTLEAERAIYLEEQEKKAQEQAAAQAVSYTAPEQTYSEPVYEPEQTYSEPVYEPEQTYTEPVYTEDDSGYDPNAGCGDDFVFN